MLIVTVRSSYWTSLSSSWVLLNDGDGSNDERDINCDCDDAIDGLSSTGEIISKKGLLVATSFLLEIDMALETSRM